MSKTFVGKDTAVLALLAISHGKRASQESDHKSHWQVRGLPYFGTIECR